MSKANKKKAKRPIHPHHPYMRLMKNNTVFYKLKSEITEEDKLLIPPPPIPPNASDAIKEEYKKAHEDWKKRTGNDFVTPPPPPPKRVIKGNKIGKTSSIEEKKNQKNVFNIIIKENEKLLIEGKLITINELEKELNKIIKHKNEAIITIKIDRNVKYGSFTKVKKILRANELYKIQHS